MIGPDDPRHGTTRGYAAGCKEVCCRRAMSRYEKRRDLHIMETGAGYSVDATGARRRIEALMAIGWSGTTLAKELGWPHRNSINRIRSCKWLERRTHDAVSDLFDRLCMTPGPSTTTRARSATAGFAPPLAWDDIDNDAIPNVDGVGFEEEFIFDHIAVQQTVDGYYFHHALSKAEKTAVVAGWKRKGGSLAELERLAGWNVHRYTASASDEAAA